MTAEGPGIEMQIKVKQENNMHTAREKTDGAEKKGILIF